MPFPVEDLEIYLKEHPVSESAETFIREAVDDVSRNVGGTTFPSVITEFQSGKMKGSVNTESYTGELAFAIHLEMDDEVLAFFEQPPPIDCCRTDKRGRKVHRSYTADYLVLHKDGPRVIQVKTDDEAATLVRKNPTDWLVVDGKVVDLPAQRAFESIGLRHTVVLSSELPQVRVENLRTLFRVRASNIGVDDDVLDRVDALLRKRAVMPIGDLVSELGLVDVSPILKLILDGEIFADIDRQIVTSTDSCLVSRSKKIVCAFVDQRLSKSYVAPTGSISVDIVPTAKNAEISLQRIEQVQSSSNDRNIRRWRELIRKNEGVPPFLVLLPRFHKSGNRKPKRPSGVLAYAMEYVRTYWATKERPSIRNAHKSYEVEARERHKGYRPITLPTFSAMAKRLKQELARARGGVRLENSLASPSTVEMRAIRMDAIFDLTVQEAMRIENLHFRRSGQYPNLVECGDSSGEEFPHLVPALLAGNWSFDHHGSGDKWGGDSAQYRHYRASTGEHSYSNFGNGTPVEALQDANR